MDKAGRTVAFWMIVVGLVLAMKPAPLACASSLRDPKQTTIIDAPRTTNWSSLSEAEQADEAAGSYVFSEGQHRRHEENRTWIWPLPAEWSKGTTTLVVNAQLELVLQGEGGKSSGSGGIVAEAFERYSKHMYTHQREKDVLRKIRRRNAADGPVLQKLIVKVLFTDETMSELPGGPARFGATLI